MANDTQAKGIAALAAQAVAAAGSDGERAMYLDTEASVEFARGKTDSAIALEEKALDLLKSAPPKERADYEKTLAKFKEAQKTGSK